MSLAAEWKAYEPAIASFASHIDAVLKFVTSNGTLVGIERAIPGGQHILDLLGLTEADVAVASSFLPAVGGLVAAYELYQALGGRPMDASDLARIHAYLEHQ